MSHGVEVTGATAYLDHMRQSAELAARVIGAWTSCTLTTASARRLLDRTRKLSDEAASILAAR